jgi:hypothetical protein
LALLLYTAAAALLMVSRLPECQLSASQLETATLFIITAYTALPSSAPLLLRLLLHLLLLVPAQPVCTTSELNAVSFFKAPAAAAMVP